jgi:hypothetical protein
MKGDWEIVKRSGRDESFWVVIHMCLEAMLVISLYNYPYLKLAKMICFSYYCLCFLFKKVGEVGRTSSAWKQGEWVQKGKEQGNGGEMALTMYANMNKGINKPELCKY